MLTVLCAALALTAIAGVAAKQVPAAAAANNNNNKEFYSPDGIQNPKKAAAWCGRPGVAHSNVCDPSNLLSKDDKDIIEGHVKNTEETESVKIGVLIIPAMANEWKVQLVRCFVCLLPLGWFFKSPFFLSFCR